MNQATITCGAGVHRGENRVSYVLWCQVGTVQVIASALPYDSEYTHLGACCEYRPPSAQLSLGLLAFGLTLALRRQLA